MKKESFVSVVVPTYNYGKFLRQCLQSFIDQTLSKDRFEVIVVDDGSTDNTQEICQEFAHVSNFIFLRKENGGTGSALNLGFRHAKGNYETWFASDNILYPTALEDMVKFLDTNKNVDYVYANCEIGIMDKDGLREIKRKNLQDEIIQTWDSHYIFERYFLGIVWLWRTKLRMDAGQWFISEPCEDYEMTLRMVQAGGKFAFYDKTLGWFRRHDGNMSAKIRDDKYAIRFVEKMVKIRDSGKKIQPPSNPDIELEDVEKYFTDVYNKNLWQGQKSRSGKGSDREQTEYLITRLKEFLQRENVKTFVDAGCGDVNWIPDAVHGIKLMYHGIDVVKPLIDQNKELFKTKRNKFHFHYGNLIRFDYAQLKPDVIFSRDVLVHLSFTQIIQMLKHIAKSGAKYFITTHFTNDDRKQVDLHEAPIKWRTLNFLKAPFNFDFPYEILNEGCTQKDQWGDYSDKSLIIFRVSDLKKHFDRIEEKSDGGKGVRVPDIKTYPIDRVKIVQKQNKIWHLEKIPKVVHFYWGGKTLPFLRYLSIYSFKLMNPDWKVHFYYPSKISTVKSWGSHEHKYETENEKNNYYDDLQEMDIEFRQLNMLNYVPDHTVPEVFKSDMFRWNILSKTGGLWSDMDILYLKPITCCPFNTEANKNVDNVISLNRQNPDSYHSIGFLMGEYHSKYYQFVNQMAKKLLIDYNDYQSLGATMLNRELGSFDAIHKKIPGLNIITIEPKLVYAFYPFKKIEDLFTDSGRNWYSDESIGIHWYAGHQAAAPFVKNMTHENYGDYISTPIGWGVNEVMRLS